jgi:NodT family efflux transporter outer membrane factor (OMF) lipoprotein
MTNVARRFALFAVIILAACRQPASQPLPVAPASAAPDPAVGGYGNFPPRTAAAGGIGGAAQRFRTDMDVPGQWWKLFGSAPLNALIDEALAANPDVAAAQAALRAAREAYLAQRASAYPNAQASFSISRQQQPTFYAPPLNNQNTAYVYGVHTISVDVGYTADVFGNLRYQRLSASAAEQVQRFQVEATYLTLTSNLVAAAVQAASLREQVAATHRVIAIDRNLLALVRMQQRNGEAAGLDVLNQEAALRQAEQTLPPLEKALAQTRDLLARLVGRSPSHVPDAVVALASLHLPVDLPLSLPSKLIEQRPDVAAASANLAQASAQVGVAYTNRLPNFPITAQSATQALSLLGLFGPGTLLSTLTAQVSATFYDHGTLKHRQASAIAAYDETAAQYKAAVLDALRNVADSVVALHKDATALLAATRAEQAARNALRITLVQAKVGQVSGVPVLLAEQAYEQAALTLVQARAARYADTVALFAALGGGWWNRNDIAPAGH